MSLFATIFYLVLMALVFACAAWDRRKHRVVPSQTALTIVIPCYNDGATVRDTVASVFECWPRGQLEVVVIDDASTDDSALRINALAAVYPIQVVTSSSNRGKAACLNAVIAEAAHELVLILDADTELNPEALGDMLARLKADPKLGAVSCPYRPANRGFLATMQAIEYNMLRLVQGAANVSSGLALWGGCLLMRRTPFQRLGGFYLGAITEDVDLAFRLNRAGWRVQQSFRFVRSHVPATLRAWVKQKLRWTGGGFQCLFRYPLVWVRHPLQPLFSLSYLLLITGGISAQVTDTSLLDIAGYALQLQDWGVPNRTIGQLINHSYGDVLLQKLISTISFYLLSVAYVLPMVRDFSEWLKILLIVPFSMAYFPAYTLVTVAGFLFWLFVLRPLPMHQRAW